MPIQSAKGAYDILPNETYKWQYIESIIREICELYNYKEIRTPIFENTDLFVRGVGESTDIVSKEMYTFLDKSERSITLRPEGTAGVCRAYVEHKLYSELNYLTKVYYLGSMFRYEKMQKGRQRQFTQFGVEALGGEDPSIDAEVISLAVNLIKKLGLKEVKVAINTLGDKESRLKYREALINHFKPEIDTFCGDCQRRLELNPLRVLDCKVDHDKPSMAKAPKMVDYLNDYSKNFFEKVLKHLDYLGIEYVLDHNLVRGLDYYNHTVFEVMSKVEGFGAQTTLCGGGRYNGLVEELEGPNTPGIGFAFGLERLILSLEAENIAIPDQNFVDVYIVSMSEKTNEIAFKLQEELRQNYIKCDKDYFNRKVKAQFKSADRYNARFTVVVGEEELENQKMIIKDMIAQTQEVVEINNIVLELKKRLEVK
ncbi:MAG: histidine--tRNA ligase [Haloplasmataceae bacterium]|jgi:histidyl-tRNA synthetase|nr:histidine--tRNA ligase [Haloplasmataceae bacterium]